MSVKMNPENDFTEKISVLFLLVFSFILYFNSMSAGFYFDDKHMIVKNLFIKNVKYLSWIFKGYVSSDIIPRGMCRPLLMLSFAFNYLTGGLNPAGYHVINILLHFLNAVLLFKLLVFFSRKTLAAPLFTLCLLFLAHPLNSETVTYLSCRSDLMVTLFIGLSFLSYLNKKRALSVLFYLFALLTKETGLCLPLLILAYEYAFGRGPDRDKKEPEPGVGNRKFIFYFLSIAAVTLVYLIYRSRVFTVIPAPFLRSCYSNILIQSAVSILYLKLFLFPHPLSLFHYFPEFSTILSPVPFFSVLGIAGLILAAVFSRKKHPLVCFGILWYLICLLPKFYARLNFVFCEHHFYMPSLGIYLALIPVARAFYSRWKRYFIIVGAGIASVFCLLVWFRNYEYTDRTRLWKLNVEREPLSPDARNQLALEYLKAGDYYLAEQEFLNALALGSRLSNVINVKINLAGIYRGRGDYQRAIDTLSDLTLLRTPPPRVYENMGIIYLEMGKEKEALSAWKKELDIYPQSPGIYAVMGIYYLEKGDYLKAESLFKKAVLYDPDFYLSYYGLGSLSRKNNDFESAFSYYRKTILLNPYCVEAHYALGTLYAETGSSMAMDQFMKVISLKKDFAPAYNDLAVCFASMDAPDWEKAFYYSKKALSLGYPVKEEFFKMVGKNILPEKEQE